MNFTVNEWKKAIFIALLIFAFLPLPSSAQKSSDLIIVNASVLDVNSGTIERDQTIIINDGQIKMVQRGNFEQFKETEILDAQGGLVTPGLIDAHGHLAYVLGDSVSAGGGFITHLDSSPDSLVAYRVRYANAYLPHGVTTVRDVGSTEEDLKLFSEWFTKPSLDIPDFYPSGGQFISKPQEIRNPFPGHEIVENPESAKAKVRSYYERGFRHIKLYWRLRYPEFRAAFDEAIQLDMNVTGHIDFHILGFDQALDLGLRNFEHAYTVGVGALTDSEYQSLWNQHVPEVYRNRREGLFHLAITEVFNQLGPENENMERLIERLSITGSTVSTSLHIFAQQVGEAPFVLRTGSRFDDVSGLTDEQRARSRKGYGLLVEYVRRMHEAGVRLVLAPDWLDPGRVALSEMMLLYKAGIPMNEVFKIATLNGAQGIGLKDRGAVEPGMRADLIIWKDNPIENPEFLFGKKLVIKKGTVVQLDS